MSSAAALMGRLHELDARRIDFMQRLVNGQRYRYRGDHDYGMRLLLVEREMAMVKRRIGIRARGEKARCP